MRRRILSILFALAWWVALGIATIPFVSSLFPSSEAGKSLPHLDISSIKPGEYAYYEGGSYSHSTRYQYLVLHQLDNSFDVLLLQVREGKIMMPDINWYNPSGYCELFSPPLSQGILPHDGEIRCLDATGESSWRNEWRWNFKGINLSRRFSNLPHPDFLLEGHDLVIGKRE